MNRQTIFEYFKTVSITMLATFVGVMLLVFIVQQQAYNQQAHEKAEDDMIDYYLIDVMIGKNKYLEQQYPDNYRINLKLGTLYKIKRDYKNAEAEYKLAIDKAPYAEYKPNYELAVLYISMNLLDEAQATMDSIEEHPDKKLIKYKADIYNKLGDTYYNQTDYENACARYKKSLMYYNLIKAKEIKLVKGNLASSYMYLAEQKLSEQRPDEALNDLKLAKALVSAPIIKYKIALLAIPTEPDLAYRYFREVFKEAPEIINYDVYSHFLDQLAKEADNKGDSATADLYRYNAKLLKDYFKTNIVSVSDVVIQDFSGGIYKSKWLRKKNIKVEFRVKNTSHKDIDSLYMEIIFKNGEHFVDHYSKMIADEGSIIKVGDVSPIINLKASNKKLRSDDSSPIKKVTVEIYISKTSKSYKLLLQKFDIIEHKSTSPVDQIVDFFEGIIDKITAKLPAFMF